MLAYFFILPRYLTKFLYIYYNRIKLRFSGATIGANCRVYLDFNILMKNATCVIGDNFTMQSGSYFNPLVRCVKSSIYVSGGCLIIGSNTGISSTCIWCTNNISIGNHVKVGANTIIMDNDAHSIDYTKRRNPSIDFSQSSPVIIEDDVLIGANSIILKGVKIGARSIIGAGSVVTKDIPSDCIAAGNPCRIIRKLT